MNYLLIGICLVSLNLPSYTRPCFKNSKTILKAHMRGKMTDDYLVLKKRGYFTFYSRVFGLTKFNDWTGSYTQTRDTLHFTFCEPGAYKEFTGKGYFTEQGKVVVLLNQDGYHKYLTIQKDRRKN